jgi:hypothetical protein
VPPAAPQDTAGRISPDPGGRSGTGEAVGVFACGPIPVYACKIEDDAIFVDIDQQLNDAPSLIIRTTEASTRVVGRWRRARAHDDRLVPVLLGQHVALVGENVISLVQG